MITYNKSVWEIVKSRYSCRTYSAEEIPGDIIGAIKTACANIQEGVFGEKAKFSFLDMKGQKNEALGAYGAFVKDNRYLIAGMIEKSDMCYESYGYLMEELVLKITDLGLQSCWFGYFNNEQIYSRMHAAAMIIPAVALVGYAADKPTLKERVARFYAKARTRKPWEELFFSGGFDAPFSKTAAGAYEVPLEMLRLAPSAGNLQPWRIVKEAGKNVFHFFMDRPNKEYDKRHLHNVDIGIAMCHFELGAKAQNINGTWKRLPQPEMPVPAGLEYRVSWIQAA